ncbi:hypothetical protein K3495_g7497 [Podosphaera aphanis]|nr:hypothetical protein K3495_g7497 [Podosphaera aphanis]
MPMDSMGYRDKPAYQLLHPGRIHGTIHLARDSEAGGLKNMHIFDLPIVTAEDVLQFESTFALGNISQDRWFSTAGVGQVKAFQRIKKNLIIDTSKPGRAKIAGIGKENLVHDAGKNFGSATFRAYAFGAKVQVTEVPIEVHNSVGKVERYHKPFKRAYSIFRKQFTGQGIDKQTCLKMATKALNDTSGPDGIVHTLCVFGTYPRITWNDPPVPNAIERAEATHRAMIELREFQATRLVQDARNMRNGSKNEHLEQVLIGGQVKVWREGGKSKKAEWTGPYELVDKDKEMITVRINDEDKRFRSTAVVNGSNLMIIEMPLNQHPMGKPKNLSLSLK